MTVLEDIIAFAKTQPWVTSVRKGLEPEESSPCWYLMVKNPKGETRFETLYPVMLKVPEIMRRVACNYGYVGILVWPEVANEQDADGFLGEKVWSRAD